MESESIKIDINHKHIYNTFKELNKILPHNFMKVKVIPSKKYHFSTKEIIDTIEKNYNLNKFINKTGKPKKSIYLYSMPSYYDNYNLEQKINLKNIISQLTLNKTKKIKNRNNTNLNRNNIFLNFLYFSII